MIRLRPFTDADTEKILSWCRDEETFYRWSAGVLGNYPATEARFRKTASLMRFTAVEETVPIGFFTARIPGDDPAELRFGFVVVDPEKRGKGAGKAMLTAGLSFAFDLYHAKRVTIVVFEDNAPARACYTAIGFCPTGAREVYRIGEKEYSAIELEYRNGGT